MQGAANAYSIDRDPRFTKWFDSVLIMDELEAFEVSCQIEPLNQTTQCSGSKESRFRRRITPIGQHRKNDSIASTVSGSSNSSTQMLCETDGSVREDDDMKTSVSLNDSVRSRVSSASSACSIPSIDTSLTSIGTPSKQDKVSDNPGDPAPDPFRTPEFYIIRVSLESSTEATEGNMVTLYCNVVVLRRIINTLFQTSRQTSA